MQMVPSEGIITFLRAFSFGNAYRQDFIDPLYEFIDLRGGPEHEFIDAELETLRKGLREAIQTFLSVLRKNTFRQREMGGGQTICQIPDEWERTEGRRYHQAIKEMNAAAENVCKRYDDLVRTARAKASHRKQQAQFKALPDRILSVLKKKTTKIQMEELKEALSDFGEQPDSDLYTIIDDLLSDGMINAGVVRSGIYNAVTAAYNIEITPRGRALTPEQPIQTKPMPDTATPKESPLFDVFISHATEDKNYVEPLVKALKAAGIRVWFDRNALEWGDDLRSSIDRGLANCRYGIVVFSKAFLRKKKWTEYELNSLFALEQPDRKIILPIWHGITRDDFLQYGAGFADRLAKISSKDTYEDIVESLLALLGRSKPQEADVTNSTVSVVAESAQAKPNAIAYAWYETTGENAAKAKAFIRPSTKQDGWFTFENSFGEEAHGTKEEIAMRFAAFDKSLKLKHYILMQHTSSDPAFRLG